jgi:hypothetical protein
MIGIYSVDSMKLRIPLQNCTDISYKLERVIESYDTNTGEMLETSTKNWERIECEGIKTKFAIETEKIGKGYVKCLTILINSKMLKRDYFSGINKATIPLIYAYCMDQKLASFTYDSFLNGYCTDIDIKRDFVESDSVIKDAFKLMKQNAIPHPEIDRGFMKKDNGIQFNKRESSSHNAPFVKVYGKSKELQTKSINFTMNHLNEIPENLWRTEYTIKNSNHLKSLLPQIENNKLLSIMECAQDDFEVMYQKVLRKCLGHRFRELPKIASTEKLTPTEINKINTLIAFMDLGMTFEVAKKTLVNGMDRVNKNRWISSYNEIFKAYIKPIENYSNYDKLEDTMVKIGWTF